MHTQVKSTDIHKQRGKKSKQSNPFTHAFYSFYSRSYVVFFSKKIERKRKIEKKTNKNAFLCAGFFLDFVRSYIIGSNCYRCLLRIQLGFLRVLSVVLIHIYRERFIYVWLKKKDIALIAYTYMKEQENK